MFYDQFCIQQTLILRRAAKNFPSYKTYKFGRFLSDFRYFYRKWRHNDDVGGRNFGER